MLARTPSWYQGKLFHSFYTDLTQLSSKSIIVLSNDFLMKMNKGEVNRMFGFLAKMPDNWDQENAPAPTEQALKAAKDIITRLYDFNVRPDDLDADVMGGIAIYISNKFGENMWINCRNSGGVGYVITSKERAVRQSGTVDNFFWELTIPIFFL